jgi:ComF family protein
VDSDVLRGGRTRPGTFARGGIAALAALADLVLPRACLTCHALLGEREADVVCGACWLRVAQLPRPRCARCGHPVPPPPEWSRDQRASSLAKAPGESLLLETRPAVPCAWCALLPAHVRSARSWAAIPGGTAVDIVHALKYGGWRIAARGMARRMATLRFPADVEAERAGLVPVPLAAGRLRERGYNQSLELARALSLAWGVPVLDGMLVRTRATTSQTRLTPGERHRNVSGAFHARAERAALRGLHLVLVDDVVTTAATLNACAAALHDGGARILSFVTFGRAPAVGDRW